MTDPSLGRIVEAHSRLLVALVNLAIAYLSIHDIEGDAIGKQQELVSLLRDIYDRDIEK